MYKYLALILVAVISFTATVVMGIESNNFRLVLATNHHLVSGHSQNVTDNTAAQNLDSSQEQNPLTIKILSPMTFILPIPQNKERDHSLLKTTIYFKNNSHEKILTSEYNFVPELSKANGKVIPLSRKSSDKIPSCYFILPRNEMGYNQQFILDWQNNKLKLRTHLLPGEEWEFDIDEPDIYQLKFKYESNQLCTEPSNLNIVKVPSNNQNIIAESQPIQIDITKIPQQIDPKTLAIDDIHFNIDMPEKVSKNEFEIKLNILNKSKRKFQFLKPGSIGIDLVEINSHKQSVSGHKSSYEFARNPQEFCPTLKPGENWSFILTASLSREPDSNKLKMLISDDSGNFWEYRDIPLGKYKIKLDYISNLAAFSRCNPIDSISSLDFLKDFWSGYGFTPLTNFELIKVESSASNTAAQKLGSSQEQNPLTIKILSPVTFILPIPQDKKRDHFLLKTQIYFKNNSDEQILTSPYNFVPELVKANGKVISLHRKSFDFDEIPYCDFTLPENSMGYNQQFLLDWQDNKLKLHTHLLYGKEWEFDIEEPDIYQLKFKYESHKWCKESRGSNIVKVPSSNQNIIAESEPIQIDISKIPQQLDEKTMTIGDIHFSIDVPEKISDNEFEIKLNILNKSKRTFRFLKPYSIGIDLDLEANPHKQLISARQSSYEIARNPQEFCPTLKPGENWSFILTASLTRELNSDRLKMLISNNSGNLWEYRDIPLGKYKIKLDYITNLGVFSKCDPKFQIFNLEFLKDFWSGYGFTPFTNFELTKSEEP